MKIYALVDVRMFYLYNMEIYPGKQPNGPYALDNSAFAVVKRIASPILNTGRDITIDNFFTSIPLAEYMLDKRTTIVGTLRKNKREIPPVFLETKARPAPSSMFAYRKDNVLVSYKAKPNKNVLLLSMFHSDGHIDPESRVLQKPEIVTFYNCTEGGVDVVDELKSYYSVSRFCCLWPLQVFFTILDVAGINSHIVYKSNTSKILERRIYLKNYIFI